MSLNITTETPWKINIYFFTFGAIPYLWWSTLIEVTPFTLKSKSGISNPSSFANGLINPPRQQSTCNPTSNF